MRSLDMRSSSGATLRRPPHLGLWKVLMAIPDFITIVGAEADYLPDGVHLASVTDVRSRFVTPFPASNTRANVFNGWLSCRTAIRSLITIQREHVDGSFISSKPDPADVDVIFLTRMIDVTTLTDDRRLQLNALLANAKPALKCDAFLVIEDCPAGHPAHGPNKAWWDNLDECWRTPRDKARTPMVGGPTKGFLEVS